jgi:hypothetical protein
MRRLLCNFIATTCLPRQGVQQLFVDVGIEFVEIVGIFVDVVSFAQYFFPAFARASVRRRG